MAKKGVLGSFEELVLLALARDHDQPYGMTVRREIERMSGREISIGAVYATLQRLEAKGMVASRVGETTSERRGRARRYLQLLPSGAQALLEVRGLRERMWKGLDLSTAGQGVIPPA